MTKDELLLLARVKGFPERVIKELEKCETKDELIATLPEAVGREVIRRIKGE